MRNWLKLNIIFAVLLLWITTTVWAGYPTNPLYVDKTRLVAQQIELLKTRVQQAKSELHSLQQQQERKTSLLSLENVNKQLLNQVALEISIAKSNLDSIDIELSEVQQTINRLEKDAQDVENQLNVLSTFGLKMIADSAASINTFKGDLAYLQNLLQLEKNRASYLQKLRDLSDSELQLYKIKYFRIDALLKSQTILQLKKQQEKSEAQFQQQQSYWLNHVNQLRTQLSRLEAKKNPDKALYTQIEREIFYANEYVNFTYLQTLIARYQEQLQQLKISVSHSNSITLLNKISEQMTLLNKQLDRMQDLLDKRLDIVKKRKALLLATPENQTDINKLLVLSQQYQVANANLLALTKQLAAFRITLDQALQQALSSRQGLPGFGAKAWLGLGEEILLVPALTFQIIKSLAINLTKGIAAINGVWLVLLALLEVLWIISFYGFRKYLVKMIVKLPEYVNDHVNLNRVGVQVLYRTLIDIAVIGNVAWFFTLIDVPSQNFAFIITLGLVWLLFKAILIVARLILVETVHDRAGKDVRLYYRLKWVFGIFGVVTGLTVFLQQLPIIYELKDLFTRIFLLFLLVLAIFLLRVWTFFPNMIISHIDERKAPYLKGIVQALGFLIPVIILINSAVGVFGFLNLVFTMSWYEGIFLIVLVGYLVVKGLVHDAMEWISRLFIRHVNNGWLWTEAILKPVDRVLRLIILLASGVVLFLLYGWDAQTPIIERITKMLYYRLGSLFNTDITPIAILELLIMVSLLYWAARWTREFVYRLLQSRTHDLGLRNSIAILSQYTIVIVGVFICLRVLGIDFKALTFVVTALAFGVGLGLRDLVNNFACGFLLLIERPLKVGDVICINGVEGDVMHLGGRAVTIRTWDHMEVIVPNVEIFNKTFTNWTSKDNIVRTVIQIKIDRQDDPARVQEIIHEALSSHTEVLRDPEPEVFLNEISETQLEIEVRYYLNLRRVKSRIGLRSEVLLRIWEHFAKYGIKPPYPHHEIHIEHNKLI